MVGLEIVDVSESAAVEVGLGAWSQPKVVFTAPVKLIVSAGVPGPTVVRDLVALESCRRQPSDRLVFHGILEVSVWFVAVTISMVTVQLRSLLQRERVTRQMGWMQSDGLLERSAPTLCRLTRQPIDQVQVDVDESGRSSSFD